jgi:hypothetical protein
VSAGSYSATLARPIFEIASPPHSRFTARRSWASREQAMASEAEWLDDVRRWYFGGTPPESDLADADDHATDLGYEAAHPALVAQHWPDAPLAAASPEPI